VKEKTMETLPRPNAKRKLILGAVVLAVAGWGCKPAKIAPADLCKQDRAIHVNRNKPTGVDEDARVVYPGKHVTWLKTAGEDWVVEFSSSPFTSGITKVTPQTTLNDVVVINVAQDTAYKYAITVDGTRHDPQIIIMGGN